MLDGVQIIKKLHTYETVKKQSQLLIHNLHTSTRIKNYFTLWKNFETNFRVRIYSRKEIIVKSPQLPP